MENLILPRDDARRLISRPRAISKGSVKYGGFAQVSATNDNCWTGHRYAACQVPRWGTVKICGRFDLINGARLAVKKQLALPLRRKNSLQEWLIADNHCAACPEKMVRDQA